MSSSLIIVLKVNVVKRKRRRRKKEEEEEDFRDISDFFLFFFLPSLLPSSFFFSSFASFSAQVGLKDPKEVIPTIQNQNTKAKHTNKRANLLKERLQHLGCLIINQDLQKSHWAEKERISASALKGAFRIVQASLNLRRIICSSTDNLACFCEPQAG